MQETSFAYFMEMLRIVEKNNTLGKSVEDAIIDMMDSYEKQATEEQKAALLKEFADYEEKRAQRDDERRKKIEADVRTLFRQDFF